ncbi:MULTISPECIES: DUF72 domain-containing protein [unclassified Janthinobacterium]|uniref:DUF72 domain-containing protein n=1 Tax=unclassified Janthinobacterium TaxID=2610881 RepID=UPI00088876B5|nr:MULTISPECIES: DUF72 domain-containing protein [unclassified Janthinobacterium]SDA71995.1 Uncharacterized conserved protein YecE, DUF72 family [Janthinobacterium sp. 551a]SFB54953.1 Uncharacterized conserved protein YecE, DUF72 family [Janthinobacterium sp. 344]
MSTPLSTPLVGTAGWSISSAAASHFPSEGSHLQRYAQVLPCVEINSSFYRPHQPATYARWAASVPGHFRFSVKLPRSITHALRLRDCAAELERFAGEVMQLEHKLGCVLVQLPPSLRFEADVATAFLLALRQRFDGMLACEARHASWFDAPATELLTTQRITRVRADPPAGQPGPHVPTTQETYLRLHGSPTIYYSDYPATFLDQLASQLRQPAAPDSWCIFDNTAAGAALFNALDLQERLAGT